MLNSLFDMKISTMAGACLLGLAGLLFFPGVAAPVRAEMVVCSLDKIPARYAAPPTNFFAAAALGQVEPLQRFLDEGVGPDCPMPVPVPEELAGLFNPRTRAGRLLTEPGATALKLAIANGKYDTAAALIAAKANLEAQTRSGLRPLDIAAERDDITGMQLVIGVTPNSDAAHLSLLVDLTAQRVTLSRDGVPVTTSKISSGRKDKPTPPGKYVVTQKYTTWRSTLYHNAPMNWFLRLSCSPVGLHQGVLPGYPASHGCVRLPADVAKKFYETVPRGTLVEIR